MSATPPVPSSARSSTPTTYSNSETPSHPSASVMTQATTVADAESSKGAHVDPVVAFSQTIQNYIFNTGFCHQQFADVQVVFFQTSLKLHRLILARSPYLGNLIMSLPPGSTMQLAFADENISQESVYICLQHLYDPASHLISPTNARAVLATALLFGAMPELAQHAYTVCAESLSASNVHEYIRWLAPRRAANGHAFGSAVSSSASSEAEWAESSDGPYGEYSARLRQDVLDFLLHALPSHLSSEAPNPAAPALHTDPRLLAAYVPLPFELFKRVVESPDLPIPFMQDRFAFVKRAIAQRKKAAATSNVPPSAQKEESVVLALKDDGDGMAVHVTRKPKRRAALWKTEG